MLYIGCSRCGVSIKAKKIFYPGRTEWSRDIKVVWNRRAESAEAENRRLREAVATIQTRATEVLENCNKGHAEFVDVRWLLPLTEAALQPRPTEPQK